MILFIYFFISFSLTLYFIFQLLFFYFNQLFISIIFIFIKIFILFLGSASFYYFVNNSTWTFITLLKPSILDYSDRFGVVVSIRDNIAVVGAPGYQENKGNIFHL